LPEKVSLGQGGPLFCAGITVFNPMVQFGVKATDRVGVIGIGGLGHLALQFLNKWGCEVYAFTSSDSKTSRGPEARRARHSQLARSRAIEKNRRFARLRHFHRQRRAGLGPLFEDAGAQGPAAFCRRVAGAYWVVPVELLAGQNSISGSPLGSPATLAKMLEFCARHNIAPVTENFPMSRVNEALEHLRAGKARYRIVLTNDIK
jgi:alcohol/geraniol dehydrogenase (NADP+)